MATAVSVNRIGCCDTYNLGQYLHELAQDHKGGFRGFSVRHRLRVL